MSKKSGFSENDFYESRTHEVVSPRLQNTRHTKLAEETFENDERMKRMFSKSSEAQNEMHKTSFLGFNGGKAITNIIILW